jgi:hypothetical protein
MNEAQFAEAAANTVEQRDVHVRQVANGFLITGTRRFLELGTGALRLQQQLESVAVDGIAAGALAEKFIVSGTL